MTRFFIIKKINLQVLNSSKKKHLRLWGEFRNLQIYKHGDKRKVREQYGNFRIKF